MPRIPVLAFALVLAAPGLAGCLEEPGGPAVQGAPKEEALAFSLRVVETYLTGNYSAFRAVLADQVYTLEGDGPIDPAEVDAWAKEEPSFPDGRDYTHYTMEQYMDTYQPRVVTFDEARAEHPSFNETTWDGWVPDGDDYIFLGAETKPGREGFLWDDLLAFAATKESGEWRFKAFSG